MKSIVVGTEVLGFTNEYFGARRCTKGNWSERIWFAWAKTFITHLVELGLTPVQLKGSANRPRIPVLATKGTRNNLVPFVRLCVFVAVC
jgi:hypothetical protein